MVHNIDNIALQIGSFSLHWYAVMYLLSFTIIYYFARKKQFLNKHQLDDLFSFAMLGVILGGRLGEVFFYNPQFYFTQPIEIIKIWKGGMSFHGGLLGVILAFYIFCKKYKINFFKLTDNISPLIPIGLFFGRIGNFINGELYGKTCKNSYEWCIIFPKVDNIARHPSQLYQAFLEGIVLFLILYFYKNKNTGKTTGLFLIGYGTARILGEIFRTPDIGIFSNLSFFSMGQWLSIPLIFLGSYLIFRNKNTYNVV